MTSKQELVFVSTRFLFPADSGGKIRTGQILRGMKGSALKIRLVMPSDSTQSLQFADEIGAICDEFVPYQPKVTNRIGLSFQRLLGLSRSLPISVLADRSRAARTVIDAELARDPSLIIFDFPHSAVLAPREIDCPSVVFTHNVEAEIFKRHWEVARSLLYRWVWKDQFKKMVRFERTTLQAFDTVIAVSDRDCEFFRSEYDVEHCASIPTGVDTDFFDYRPPSDENQVVFCGSMDWMANIDAIEFFHDEVWPLVRLAQPDARMKVVGRRPADSMIKTVRERSPEWEFTGFVDDVRDHVAGAAVFVIPLRVGGGTRIKAFEAMAMGCPVVSTSVGMEGLPVEKGVHYLDGDSAEDLASSVIRLLQDKADRLTISKAARQFVEERFGYRRAAAEFEQICLSTIDRRQH